MNTAILFDIIPVKYRRIAYAIVTLVAFLFGLWQASDGEWGIFIGSLLAALVTAMAAGNSVPLGSEAPILVYGDPLDDEAEPDLDETVYITDGSEQALDHTHKVETNGYEGKDPVSGNEAAPDYVDRANDDLR